MDDGNWSEDDVRVPHQSESDSSEDARYGVRQSFGGERSRRPRKRPRITHQLELSEKKEEPGAWEKHTRGIGSKLLAKMGFTGRLGARADGIAEPVSVAPRVQSTAGLGKFREREPSPKKEESEEKEEEEEKSEIPRWKKKSRGRAVTIQPKKKLPPKELFFDMRAGKSVEVGSAVEIVARKASSFAAPEFVHNARLLRDQARVEVDDTGRAIETEREIRKNARVEEARLVKEIKKQEDDIVQLEALARKMMTVKEASSNEAFVTALRSLRDCNTSDTRFPLQDALCELAAPRLRRTFRAAARGQHGADAHDAARILKALPLEDERRIRLATRTILREARTLSWTATESNAFAEALSAVSDILHPTLLCVFSEEILIPKLETELRRGKANALMPPHVWIHPWLPVVGSKALESLFPLLRPRFVRVLSKWDPSSNEANGAQNEIRAWLDVLPRRKIHATVERSVASKISRHLAAIDRKQRAQIVTRIISQWVDLVPPRALVQMVLSALWEDIEFVKDALFGENISGGEVVQCTRTYNAWRNALAPVLKYARHVLAAFLFVLAVHARTRDKQVARAQIRLANVRELAGNRYKRERIGEIRKREDHVGDTAQRETIQDAVSALASLQGLALLPDGRDRDGRAIFRLGGVRVVIDGVQQLVLLLKGSQPPQPVALDRLIELATIKSAI